MHNKLLLVTIPSYRQPEQLDRALQGLANQTCKDFSVVIIDDNSGTDIASITKKYKDNISITVEKNENNIGAMNNLYRSITFKTNSKYILSHHEDDYLKIDYIENALKLLEENSNSAFAITKGDWILKNDTYRKEKSPSAKHSILNKENFITSILRNEPFIFGSVIYRVSDIHGSFELEKYHTLCDRVFLADLLNKEKKAIYLETAGIFVQDHSVEGKNPRPVGMTFEHVLNYYRYYQKNLDGYSFKNKRLITNSFLLSGSCFWKKMSLTEIWRSQKPYNLITIKALNYLGFYAILRIIFR